MPTQVGLISLGCVKNLIDSEIMAGHLTEEGMTMTKDEDRDLAGVLIVNTCSFIDVTKEESIETINARHCAPAKEKQKIIDAGRLSQHFNASKNEDDRLPGLHPEVDAFIGLDQVNKVSSIIKNVIPLKNHSPVSSFIGTIRP